MKHFIKIILSLLIVAGFTSCVDDKDYDTPQVTTTDEDISTTNLMAIQNSLKQGYQFGDPSTLVYTFPELLADGSNKLIAAAYVVGDDTSGNFYKKLIVQDKPENPTAGLEIRIDEGNLHNLYNVGRKIYIQLNGLSVGYYDGSQGGAPGYVNQSEPGNSTPGVYKLGVLGEDFAVDRISDLEYKDYITRSSTSETIVPTIITSYDISDATMNTAVQFENMQFELGELSKTYAGQPDDSYDASRFLVSCETEYVLGLMTSTYSSFKSLSLPQGKGNVTGVLAKNYRENDPVIILNSPNDVDFTDMDRCDPPLFCDAEAIDGSMVIYEEDFENVANEAALDALNWTNINVNGGSNRWQVRTYNNNKYMQVGAYNSGENPLEAWLVTPAINLDSSTDEALTFDVNVGYHNGNPVTVYASSDYTGDVTTATWEQIGNVELPTGPTSGYGSFGSAGKVNISCLSGDVHIAFKYAGADGGITTTFQIDNVKITGN